MRRPLRPTLYISRGESLYGHLDNVAQIRTILLKNKRSQAAIAAQKNMALISKELVKIVCDLDLKLSYHETSYKLKFTQDVENFLNKVGFRSWLTKLESFRVNENQPQVSIKPEKVETFKIERWGLEDFKKKIADEVTISITHISDDELNQHSCWRGLAVATSKALGYLSIDFNEAKKFVNILHESHVLVVCYQSKPILQLAMISGLDPKFKYFDLAQAHFILNPEYRHDFATIIEEFLGWKLQNHVKNQIDLFGNESEEEIEYLGRKAEATLKLYTILKDKMKEMDVERPYSELDIPLIKVLASMELEGISLDIPFYKELEIEFSSQIEEIEKKVFDVSGEKINLRSPKQVGELLFEKLQLPIIRKTKTEYSTDAEVLSTLAALDLNPIPRMLLKYREIEKLLSTYVRALPTMVDPKTKKIIPIFSLQMQPLEDCHLIIPIFKTFQFGVKMVENCAKVLFHLPVDIFFLLTILR